VIVPSIGMLSVKVPKSLVGIDEIAEYNAGMEVTGTLDDYHHRHRSAELYAIPAQ
jgi:hypothetical protein